MIFLVFGILLARDKESTECIVIGFKHLSLSRTLPIFSQTNSARPISSPSISLPHTTRKPRTPLFLRLPSHSATPSDLRQWKNWDETQAASVGSKFLEADNGPDSGLLLREHSWLIEDAPLHTQLVGLRVELGNLFVLWKQRIEERRPFQNVVGCERWRDLILSVEEGVLIPRPETETVVELVGDVIKSNEDKREGLWADLRTGRILGECGRVIATDLSPVPVAVASYNVQRYNVQVSSFSFD